MRRYRVRKFRGTTLRAWVVQEWAPVGEVYVTVGATPRFLDAIRLVRCREQQRLRNTVDHHLEPCS